MSVKEKISKSPLVGFEEVLARALVKIGVIGGRNKRITRLFDENFKRLLEFRQDGKAPIDCESMLLCGFEVFCREVFSHIGKCYLGQEDTLESEIITGSLAECEGETFTQPTFHCDEKIDCLELMLRHLFASKQKLMNDEFFYELFRCAAQLAFVYCEGGAVFSPLQLNEIAAIMVFSVSCATHRPRSRASVRIQNGVQHPENNFSKRLMDVYTEGLRVNFEQITNGELKHLFNLKVSKVTALKRSEKARLARLLCGDIELLCKLAGDFDISSLATCARELVHCSPYPVVRFINERNLALVDLITFSLSELQPYFRYDEESKRNAATIIGDGQLLCFMFCMIDSQRYRSSMYLCQQREYECLPERIYELCIRANCIAHFCARDKELQWNLTDLIKFQDEHSVDCLARDVSRNESYCLGWLPNTSYSLCWLGASEQSKALFKSKLCKEIFETTIAECDLYRVIQPGYQVKLDDLLYLAMDGLAKLYLDCKSINDLWRHMIESLSTKFDVLEFERRALDGDPERLTNLINLRTSALYRCLADAIDAYSEGGKRDEFREY